VLLNRDSFPVHRLADALEELLFEDQPTMQPIPLPLDEELQEDVAGTYRDSTGTDFIVSAEGLATTVRIEWSSGPVTHTFMGVTDDGELVLYEWSEVTPVRLDRRAGKKARGLELFGREFERK
jgi:hypothetical protein